MSPADARWSLQRLVLSLRGERKWIAVAIAAGVSVSELSKFVQHGAAAPWVVLAVLAELGATAGEVRDGVRLALLADARLPPAARFAVEMAFPLGGTA
jgi:hypothetical protein